MIRNRAELRFKQCERFLRFRDFFYKTGKLRHLSAADYIKLTDLHRRVVSVKRKVDKLIVLFCICNDYIRNVIGKSFQIGRKVRFAVKSKRRKKRKSRLRPVFSKERGSLRNAVQIHSVHRHICLKIFCVGDETAVYFYGCRLSRIVVGIVRKFESKINGIIYRKNSKLKCRKRLFVKKQLRRKADKAVFKRVKIQFRRNNAAV